jgi:peptide deformylase
VGLAAPQAGHLKRVIVVKDEICGKFTVMVNPVIIEWSDDLITKEESCLSYPGESKKIARFRWIEVEYIDEDGDRASDVFAGQQARIIQHEIDHLNRKCRVGEN